MALNTRGNGFVWLLAGAAVGVAVAMLYAPKSGKDSRQYIVDKTDEGRASLAESGTELIGRGKDLYERGRALADEAADLFQRGRTMVRG